MRIADFGRRFVRYFRLLRAMPGRTAQLPDLRTNLEQLRADLAEQRAAARAGVEQLRADLAEQSTAARAGVEHLRAGFAEQNMVARAGLEQLRADFTEQITAARAELEHLRAELAEQTATARAELKQLSTDFVDRTAKASANIVGEIAAQLGFASYDFDQQLSELESRLNALDAQTSEAKNNVLETRNNVLETKNNVLETKNIATHINTSVHSRLNTLEFKTIDGLYEQLRELAANQFELSSKADSNLAQCAADPAERYARANPAPFQSYLARAEKDFSQIYPLWQERLDTMQKAFRETKVGNAAQVGDPDSRVFRRLVGMYAAGRVLDVGCGVFGRPYYLMDYPAKLISGLEPLPMIELTDFEVVRGLGEYLPWPDESFSTVISATSLDHCMSLKRSLDEIVRVLRPEGRFLLWIDSVPGAPAYEPDKPDFKPADQFHLFHFEKSWLEPMLEQSFKSITQTELRRSSFSRIMYFLVKK